MASRKRLEAGIVWPPESDASAVGMRAPLPDNESHRLAALHRYAILDTPPEPVLDDLARLAAQVCRTPMAAVGLVDAERLWFKARVGIDRAETPRDGSFCAHAILSPHVMVVADAAQDPRFSDSPLVGAARGLRFYAGWPLVSPDGHALGTLCVLDREPRGLCVQQIAALGVLSRAAMGLIDARRGGASRAPETASENEARLRAMLDGAGDAIALHETDGRFLEVNRRACESLGYTRDELLQLSVGDVDVEWPRDRVLEASGALAHGQIVTGAGTHRRRDGSSFPVEVRVSLVVLGGRKLMAAVARDVTERALSEAALVESERRYRVLFESTPAFTCTHDLAGRLLTVNPAAAHALGFEPADLAGRLIPELMAPAFGRRFQDYLRALGTRRVASGTLSVVTRNGSKRLWRYRSVLQQEGGTEPYVIGCAEDVTELMRLASEHKQRALTDPLTGIANRRAGEEALARESARAARHRLPLAVALFDVDRFKALNDRHGHGAGDRALREIARLLQGAMRSSDHLVRWGGEEFLAILPGEPFADALIVAERARRIVESSDLTARLGITISAGVAELMAGEAPAEALRRADAALYRAKAAGRNRVR